MNPENGGPCQGIRNMIPALSGLDVVNEVLSFDAPDAAFLGKDNFVIHAIGPAKGPYAYCKNLKPWLLENLGRFDAVIIHGLWQYNSYGTYKAWKEFKRTNNKAPKLFVMPHGMLDPYFQRAKERRVKAVRNWLFWKLFENKVINGATGVLFTCQEELLLARETFRPYAPENEINVGYGVQQPPAFTEQMREAFADKYPAKEPYLLFLSRIHHKKGVDILIKAYLEAKQNNTLPSLVIAGPGLDSAFGKEMQLLAGSGNNIYFPGMLSGNSKWGAFYGAEAFILPSHQENFGIAVVEALACNKPALISDQVNIWREISNGNGGIIKKDTTEGVSAMLKEWAGMTPAQQNEMSTGAGNVYLNNYIISQAALQFYNAISKIV